RAVAGYSAKKGALSRTSMQKIAFDGGGMNRGDRHGQRRAEKQPGSQEAQEGKDQDHCRGAKPEDGWRLAADRQHRQEEITARSWRHDLRSWRIVRSRAF